MLEHPASKAAGVYGRGALPREPDDFGTHVGAASGRPFFADEIGFPIRELSTDGVTISSKGIDRVEFHLSRFGSDEQNARQLLRLRAIVAGTTKQTQTDFNFYTHELREYARYRALGYPAGQPIDPDAAYRLWNNAHTASLEDYGLQDGPGVLYTVATERWDVL